MHNRFSKIGIIAIGILQLSAVSLYAQGLTCGDVYSNAIANVEVSVSEKTERSYYFNLYCEKSGEMRSFASSGSFSFPIEGLPISVSDNKEFDQTALKEFCKVGAEKKFFDNSDFAYGRYVSEGALRSYNDCRALELNKVFVTHRTTPPEGFTVFVEFRGVTSAGTLDVVGYDLDKINCTSAAFTESGQSEQLHGSMNRTIGKKNFSIDCARKGEATSNGVYYPGAEFRLSTSWGPYVVSVPPDTRMGFDLVSQAEAAHGEVVNQLAAARASSAENKRLANAYLGRINGLQLLTVYQGDGGWKGTVDVREPCPQQGGQYVTNDTYMKNICVTRGLRYKTWKRNGDVAGGICGHSWFAAVCLGK